MSNSQYYKNYDNKDFNETLNKFEFATNQSENKKSHIHQEPAQMLMRNFISKNTIYENILLYNDVGVGKTCNSITIAEGFKEYIHNLGKKVFVLVKNKNIQKNFMDELLSKCTRDEYIDDFDRPIYSGEVQFRGSETKRDEIIHRAQKTINASYQFVTYGTFVNRVLGAKEFKKDEFGRNTKIVKRIDGEIQRKNVKDGIRSLNNTVIIVDEVHNITNNDTYTSLMKVLSNSYNYRLILLTATPIFDNSKAIFELSNLLNANNKQLQLPIRDKLFDSVSQNESAYLIKQQSSYINTNALKGGIIKITERGLDVLTKSLYGKVSYLKANTETNPKSIVMGEKLIDRKGTTNVVYCQMSKYQYKVYLKALQVDLQKDSKYDLSTAIQQIESEENNLENEIVVSKTSSLYKNSNDASTMTYPELEYGKTGFLNVFKKSGSGYSINKDHKAIFTTELKQYSNKLYKLLQNINKTKTGNCFIYSNYVSYGGTSLVRQLLLLNGFQEFKNKNNITLENEHKCFIVFDESTSIDKREQYKRIFNNEDNKDGKFIRIIIGSPIISEGITLKAIRQVHILEPYWNMSKINQIIGRAVRNYSHHSLEPSERTVEIYKYVSVHYDQNINVDRNKLTNFFIDREKYILSEEKDRSNKIVERRLKELSFDCTLNSTRNKINDPNLAGSAECDYTNCDYQCLIKPKNDIIDKSTYNMYITLYDNISGNTNSLSEMYNRDGFIINRGPYYIFNNSELDIDGSLYSKILDFSVDKTKYTLQQFTKTNLKTNIFEETKKKSKEIEELDEESILKNQLTKQALEYNKHIEDTYDIYGTYRMKKLDSDKWEHKYGKLDTQFKHKIR